MKRRSYLAASVVGISAISGCMGLFQTHDSNQSNNPNQNSPNQNISLPHDGLAKDYIPDTFIQQHFQTLQESRQYTVKQTKEIDSQKTIQTSVWERQNEKGLQIVQLNGSPHVKRYYSGTFMGVNSVDENSVDLFEQVTPSIRNWANASYLTTMIKETALSLSDENKSSVIYTGTIDNQEYDNKNIRVYISKSQPVITKITVNNSKDVYSISKIDETTVSAPTWFTNTKQNNVIISGGVYKEMDSIVINIHEDSQPIPQGSLLSVIPPQSQSQSMTVPDKISAGSTIYIFFRNNTPQYTINSPPSVSNRDSLKQGSYIVSSTEPSGNQLFETQFVVE